VQTNRKRDDGGGEVGVQTAKFDKRKGVLTPGRKMVDRRQSERGDRQEERVAHLVSDMAGNS